MTAHDCRAYDPDCYRCQLGRDEAIDAMPKPYPGSDAAVEDGCICPRLDNGRGNAALAYDRGGWIVTVGCPLHSYRATAPTSEGGPDV